MDEDQKREAFAQHWMEAEPSISAYVFASVSRFHDAEDIVQRIAQELARRYDQYDPERPFVGWALWIARSRVIDWYRASSRNKLIFSDELLGQLADTIASHADGRNQRREALETCLEELPTKSRQLLNLRYVDDLTNDEVAAKSNSTGGSVRVRLSRVRTALLSCIERRIAMEST
ncbi:MAG: sigma-70 family RNA polymerase sigma factor [Planctomycetota bacterium]